MRHRTSSRVLARARSAEGQAYVEFAFVLPVLLLVVMGIIQFGMVFRDYIALTDAVRVGGRQAAVARSIQPESDRVPVIVAKVQSAAVGLDAAKMTITVDPRLVDGNPGWEETGDVTVRASYPLKVNLFGLVIFDSSINSRTTERVE